ncbi:MAG: hypothetical protein ABH812_01940 [bacterium]
MAVETLNQTYRFQHPLREAFDIEYKRPVNENALHDDIVSYLGEYRFKVPTYDYEIYYSVNLNGAVSLRDKYDGDTMTDKAKRAIKKNEEKGRSSKRERAELLGLQVLEQQLEDSVEGDVVLWTSPPGPKEEGYGDYGYVYIGSVECLSEEKKISMTAVRIEEPTLEQFSFYMSLASGVEMNFQNDTDFLSNPIIIKSPLADAKKILFDVFNFKPKSEIQQRFLNTIRALSPLINALIRLTQEGASYEERRGALNVLENLTADLSTPLKVNFDQRLNDLKALSFYEAARRYGYEPKRVAGSCGSSGTTNSSDILSNNIFNSIGDVSSILDNNNEKDDMFECPSCHQLSKPPVGNCCPKCNITFEEYRAQAEVKGELICKQSS